MQAWRIRNRNTEGKAIKLFVAIYSTLIFSTFAKGQREAILEANFKQKHDEKHSLSKSFLNYSTEQIQTLLFLRKRNKAQFSMNAPKPLRWLFQERNFHPASHP